MTTLPSEFPESDRFVIDRFLGKGSFGVVYRAYDRRRHAQVALKLLARPNISGDLYRFKQEFRALSDLSHPHLVSLYELLLERGHWFIVMELVEGTDFISHISASAVRGQEPAVDRDQHASEPTLASLAGQTQSATSASPGASVVTPFDLLRLELSLSQLARALCYLHSADRLHRDIKPSNVLVTTDGRIKVLDFGLVIELTPETPDETLSILGTPAYMSPEHMCSQPLTQASDWYSVGVLLYRALTGSLPFTGSVLETLEAKQRRQTRPPHVLVNGIPAWLSDLTWDLLAPRPEDRPSGQEVLERIPAQRADVGQVISEPMRPVARWMFVGRKQHLDVLTDAYETVKDGRAAIVHVHGSSGMGKTALVRRFLEQLRANEEDVVVLSGRCYERESVPYKALDSIVDRLTRYLRGLSELEAEALLPRDVRALARLFPMLGEVEAVGRASERGVEIRDSQELRRRGFAAFRELIGRLSDQGPVVVFIDDLQWGDDDSIVLLTELMRPPDAPAILLILCYRSEEETSSATLRALFSRRDAASPEVDVRDLEVGEMGQSEARQLAMSLLKDDDGRSRDLAETIAQESHGSPFFLDALVRHWQSSGRPQTAPPPSKTDGTPPFRPQPTVESLIVDRIAGLSPAARRLVEILAVFGQPLQVSLASRAADLEEEELGAMAALRVERLTRTRFTDRGDEMEVYHDRIRETVLALLSPPALKAYHRRLATALEEADWADSETLAWHFSEAGDRDRATAYAVRAADRAREAMAFDRAARLYRSALAMGEAGDNERTSGIQMRLGDVLAGAGRGYEAAVAYLAAARGALVAEQLELKRRAADQLFRSGYMNEGYGVMGSVLDALGMKLAATPVQARLSFLRQRVLVRLSGLRFHERDRSQISAEELVRVDACWSVAIGLGLVDAIRGADFQARHLLLALKAGDPLRIARALAVELPYASLGGPRTRRRTERLAAVAEQVVARVSDPSAVALLALAKGAASFFQGRWRTTRELLDRAEAILREKCTGVAWELNAANFYLVLALFYLGEVRELRVRVPSLLKQAEERDDLAGTTNLRTRVSYLVSLADDEPAHARADVQEGMARWPRQTFHSQHSWELYAQGEIHLYEGHGVQAWDLVSRIWPALKRSALLRIQNVRIESYYLRARCALGASLDPATRPDQRTVLRRCAWRDIGRLARENSPWATAVSDLVGAAAALAEGRRDSALSRLRAAEDAFSALDMPLHGAVAKRRRGALIDGSDGRVLVEQADAWMSAQTIRSPANFAAMLAPGPSEFADVRNRT